MSVLALVGTGLFFTPLFLRSAQAPTYTQGPDTISSMDAHAEFAPDGTLRVFRITATFSTTIINTSDLRDTSQRKAGEITVDMLTHPERLSCVNEEMIAAICLKEWLAKHPPVFMPTRRALREPVAKVSPNPSGK